MAERTPYDILGVPKTASQDEIRQLYKELARKFHPDRNPGDDAALTRFKEISAAYRVLGDPDRRELYDEFGELSLNSTFNAELAREMLKQKRARPTNPYAKEVTFDDILGGAYKGPDHGPAPRKQSTQGPFRGGQVPRGDQGPFPAGARPPRNDQGPFPGDRPSRNDQGPFPGDRATRSDAGPYPNGAPPPPPRASTRSGPTHADPRHRFQSRQTQAPARGTDLRLDQSIDVLTALRGGEIRVQVLRPSARGMMEEVALRVRVPPGVQDGAVIRLRGQAGAGRMGAQAGDVLLTLRVASEGALRKHGQDLLLDVPVTIGEALLGGRISVPTPFGELQVAIPAGSGEGTTLRVRGRGLGGPEGRRSGDLVLVLRPQVPDLLTEETLELARRLERQYTRNVRSDMEF